MVLNYLLTALRNIIRNKSFTLLNILGLSLTMSVCMLIIVVLMDQYSYDSYYTKKDRIYRVESIDSLSKISLNRFASTTFPLAGELKNNATGIEETALFNNTFNGEGVSGDIRIGIKGLYANSAVFSVFGFELEEGSPERALDDPYKIVLKEDVAKKFFGNEDPLGKTLQVDSIGNFTVAGILKKNNKKSHIQFEALVSASTLESFERSRKAEKITATDWNNFYSSYLYVLLSEKADNKDIQLTLDKINHEKYLDRERTNVSFVLQPLSKIVPGPLRANELGFFLWNVMVYFLSGLALVLVVLAAFNYTSLSIARSLLRAKEVGVRKTLGASRGKIISQFLLEAVMISLLALVVSVILLQFLLPGFTGMKMMSILEIRPQQNYVVYLLFFIFALVTGLLAGILPAFFISSFSPQHVLKGVLNIKLFSRITLRKVLLVTQFAFSMIFIITILLLFRQMNYMVNAKMGFDREQVFMLRLQRQDISRIKDVYSRLPEISYISATSHRPGEGNIWPVDIRINKEDEKVQGHYFSVDENYIPAMGLTLLAGQNFPPGMNTEREKFVVVNEYATHQFKLGTPSEAIGKYLILDDSTYVQVIGVIKDYKYAALFLTQKSLILRVEPNKYNLAVFRFSSPDLQGSVEKLKIEWKKIDPVHEMQGDFLDNTIKEYYSFFGDVLYTVGYACFLVIIISCLGLLGMATFSTQTRIREIAIRKAYGAMPANILLLISRGYIGLLIIAAIIAAPLAYLLNKMWFQYMVDHVSFGAGTLLFGILFVVFIGLLTIGSQTIKASRTNPAEMLKFE
jgi:putative ABC transport system permease protein